MGIIVVIETLCSMGEDNRPSVILDTIKGITTALLSHIISCMMILDTMMTILGFMTIRISVRMIGVSFQRTVEVCTQRWVGNNTGCSVILYIHAPVHIYGVTHCSTTTTSDVVVAYNTSGPWNLMLSGHANY